METGKTGPCAKQVVTCTLVHPDGRRWVGRNDVSKPQATCPRGALPSGVGYELCASVCGQNGHAEEQVLKLAGKDAKGCTAYVEGIHYICMNCQVALVSAGVTSMVLGAAPAAQSQPAGAPTRSPHGYVNFETLDYVVAFGNDAVPEGYFPVTIWNDDLAAQPAGAGAPSDAQISRVGQSIAAGKERILVARAITVEWADRIVAALARQGAAPAQAEPVAMHSLEMEQARDLLWKKDNADANKMFGVNWVAPMPVPFAKWFEAGWIAGVTRATAPAPAGVAQADVILADGYESSTMVSGVEGSMVGLRYKTAAQAEAAHEVICARIDAAIQASANNTGSEG